MPRPARGLTLTSEERALVAPTTGGNSSSGPAVHSHSLTVVLPDSASCPVAYSRLSSRSHRFEFGPPLRQGLWAEGKLDGIAAIEAKAKDLMVEALCKVREEEQKSMQRQPPARQSIEEAGHRSEDGGEEERPMSLRRPPRHGSGPARPPICPQRPCWREWSASRK
jgi:hypothetical protein